MKKLKLKLADRISISFVTLFLVFMTLCGFFVVSFLRIENRENIKVSFENKRIEVNHFLDKIDSFSKKYESITLEFNPKIENKSITYSKPFNIGNENFKYVIRVRNKTGLDEIALNTFDESLEKSNIITILTDFNSDIPLNYVNKSFPINVSYNNKTYSVIRVSRDIGGNLFDIYVLKDITNEITTYKTLVLLIALYALIGLAVIVVLSNIFTKRILKPVNTIISTASSLSTNDLTIRIPRTNTNDELDNLILIINNMLERLNIAFDNQSKFISDVSHELRTPLAIIKGYAELIKRHGKNKEELITESVDLIINESNNMKNLIDKLLFLARGDANTIKINQETFDSVEFINQVYSDALFFSKGHNLIIEKNEKYTMFADRSLLQQALRTILENSVKYSDKGTNIYINSIYDQDLNAAVISIRDEGIGIEEQYLEKIFQRFYRVDESRTKETGGTGLGLSIVKKVVSIHGGDVKVNSKIDVGSEFILTIPSRNINKLKRDI